jgi:para-nitrobenzyl esterase
MDPRPREGREPSPILTARIPRATPASPAARPPESEDCLFLNVWTGRLADGRNRPVMVWLHGGFFRSGSGSSVDGAALAGRGDVVVVSLNHRLNIFGYNHLADIAGAEFRNSGNAGMLDILAALRWIRDNIERFGGDPKRVMVFGASGGGMKTAFLMASPFAAGLLHRAGVQSGPGLAMMEREAASAAVEMALHELGLSSTNAADLRLIAPERLLAAFHSVNDARPAAENSDLTGFAPVRDGELLPRHPFDPQAAFGTDEIPMLLGWNREDMAFFMGADPGVFELTPIELERRFESVLGDRAAEGLAMYRELHPDLTPAQTYVRLVTDREMMTPTIVQATRHANAGSGGTYIYRFDWPSPAFDGRAGAFHTLEADFVFDRAGQDAELTGSGPAVRSLAAAMSEAWINFAASGVPSAEVRGLPAWPRFEAPTHAGMIFDDISHATQGVAQPEFSFLIQDREPAS